MASAPRGLAAEATAAPSPRRIVDAHPFERAAEFLVECLRAQAASHARAIRLAIPGGSALAALVAARQELERLASRIALTWVDERCVPLASPESNRGEALRRGLDGVASHMLPLYEDGETPESAVARARQRLRSDFAGGLDLVVLGLGSDGHIASLFPGRPWPDAELAAYVPDSPKPPAERITLCRSLLASARDTLVVAAGPDKREAIRRLSEGDPRLPATGLPGLVIVTDERT